MVPPADDAVLVAAAQSGDTKALDALLRRHHDQIYGLCRRLTGNDADALDATQEALMAVVRGLDGFDGRARFGTWVYRVSTNACFDELRRRKRRPVPLDEETHPLHERPDPRTPPVGGYGRPCKSFQGNPYCPLASPLVTGRTGTRAPPPGGGR